MVKVRLQRTGRKNQPEYRVVVADSKAKRDGKYIELLGHYSPVGNRDVQIDVEKYKEWTEKGAQPTKRVERLVRELGEASN